MVRPGSSGGNLARVGTGCLERTGRRTGILVIALILGVRVKALGAYSVAIGVAAMLLLPAAVAVADDGFVDTPYKGFRTVE